MTWESYCREEAIECEKLARDVEGDARNAWLDAARQWWMQVTKSDPAEGSQTRT
jgi:hypothetical protein